MTANDGIEPSCNKLVAGLGNILLTVTPMMEFREVVATCYTLSDKLCTAEPLLVAKGVAERAIGRIFGKGFGITAKDSIEAYSNELVASPMVESWKVAIMALSDELFPAEVRHAEFFQLCLYRRCKFV